MKSHFAQYAMGLLLLTGLPLSMPAQTAKDDIEDAGHSTRRAVKKTGRATSRTAKTGARKVKRGTKKVTHKAAAKTEHGAAKVKRKTS